MLRPILEQHTLELPEWQGYQVLITSPGSLISDICICKVVAQPALTLDHVACLAHYHQVCVPVSHEVSNLVIMAPRILPALRSSPGLVFLQRHMVS